MRLSLGILSALLAGVGISASTRGPYKRQNDTVPSPYTVKESPGNLTTRWTHTVGEHPWPQYPRPLLERSDWKNLNGLWQYRNASDGKQDFPPFGQNLDQEVLVPFCLESALSGKSYNAER
jgi:hypothetical protein